ncbi:MAG: AI-2E family transporter [Myxococcota bacterium]
MSFGPRTVWMVGLNVLCLALLVAVVARTWMVISWILIALLLALALEPAVQRLSGTMPRVVSVLVLFGCFLAAMALGVRLVLPLFIEQARRLVERTPELVAGLKSQPWIAWLIEDLELHTRLLDVLRRQGPGVVQPLFDVVRKVFTGLLATGTVLTLTAFMLLFGPPLVETGLGWAHPSERARYRRLGGEIVEKVGGYVAGTLLVALLAGVVTAFTTLILGVPYFLALGLAMAVLALVPFVGPAVGLVLAVGTTLATQGPRDALLCAGVLLVYPQLKNRLIQPLVLRRTIRMNPLLITLVMLVGTALAGLLGTVLALPVAAAIQVVLEDVKRAREDRWELEEEPAAPPPH